MSNDGQSNGLQSLQSNNSLQNCGQGWQQWTGQQATSPDTLEALREKLQTRASHLRRTIQAVDAARAELDLIERMLQVTA